MPDRGQPTYFYTRFNRQLFSVHGAGRLGARKSSIWTLVAHGQSETRRRLAAARLGDRTSRHAATDAEESSRRSLTLAGRAARGAAGHVEPDRDGDRRRTAAAARRAAAAATPIDRRRSTTRSSRRQRRSTSRRSNVRCAPRSTIGCRSSGSSGAVRPRSASTPPARRRRRRARLSSRRAFTGPGEYVLRARATDSAASTLQEIKVVVGPPAQ